MKQQISNPLKIIKEKVEDSFKVNLTKKCRSTRNVEARYIFYRLCRDFTFCTLHEIGLEINRHHASVFQGLKQFDNSVFTNDIQILNPYKELKNFLYNTLIIEDKQNQHTTMKDLYEENVKLKKKYELLKLKSKKNN